MKHNIKITSILVLIFILSQLVGLLIVDQYYSTNDTGVAEYKELPMNIERPAIQEKDAWIYILSAILIGTLIMLGLIKMKARVITKIWFFFAIAMSLTIGFGAFIPAMTAMILAGIMTFIRLFKPNVIINNFSELFIYGGITAIFHNILSIKVAIIILILISIYDFIAVYKIKHMITLAKFQTKEKIFAGAMIPYELFSKKEKKKQPSKSKKINHKIPFLPVFKNHNKVHTKQGKTSKTAILGGGDMAFSLFFTASIMKEYSITIALITVLTSTLSLIYLFTISKKGKFYPAMPYITTGCLIGYGIILLISI